MCDQNYVSRVQKRSLPSQYSYVKNFIHCVLQIIVMTLPDELLFDIFLSVDSNVGPGSPEKYLLL